MKLIHIFEANKAEQLGHQLDSIKDTLIKYMNDPNYFVTIHQINKIGINPTPKYLGDHTPMGIYTFRLQDFSQHLTRRDIGWIDVFDQGGFITKDGNKFISILKYNGQGRYIDDSYSVSDGKSDYNILKQKYNVQPPRSYNWPDIFNLVYNIAYDIASQRFEKLSPDKQSERYSFVSGSGHSHTSAGAKRLISHQVVWNDILRNDLNWGVVVDTNGVISKWEPNQAWFSSTKSIKVIKTFPLPPKQFDRSNKFLARMEHEKTLKEIASWLRYYMSVKDMSIDELVQNMINDLIKLNLPNDQIDKVKASLIDVTKETQLSDRQKAHKLIKKYYKMGGTEKFKL